MVEDDARLRRIIARYLDLHGYAVREASGVNEALQALAAEVPDLLLLDVDLPDGTGWDVLRQAELVGGVRVVLVTGTAVSAADLDEFWPAAYLPKPFSLEALSAVTGDPSRANASGVAR